MANELPALKVLENNLPSSHPGSAFPAGRIIPPCDWETDNEAELASLYEPVQSPQAGLPIVRANFITTLDGSVIGANGKSGSINGPADLRVFQLLRAQCDAVFVGAGTARIEGYQDTDIPTGLQELRNDAHPRLITVTRSGDLAAEFLATKPLVITAGGHPAAQKLRDRVPVEDLLVCGTESVDFTTALRELKSRGIDNVLCEGGPHLMGALISAGLVTELCLSFSPVLVGGSGYRFVVGELAQTAAQLQVLLSAPDGFLLSRWTLDAH